MKESPDSHCLRGYWNTERNPWEWERPSRNPEPVQLTAKEKKPKAKAKPVALKRMESFAKKLLAHLEVPEDMIAGFVDAPSSYDVWRLDNPIKKKVEFVSAKDSNIKSCHIALNPEAFQKAMKEASRQISDFEAKMASDHALDSISQTLLKPSIRRRVPSNLGDLIGGRMVSHDRIDFKKKNQEIVAGLDFPMKLDEIAGGYFDEYDFD